MDGDQKRSPSLAPGVLYRDAPCGLVEASVDGNILHCNEAFQRLTGFSLEQLLRHRFHDLLSPAGRILYETQISPLLLRGGAIHEFALDIMRADGTRASTMMAAQLIRYAQERTARLHLAVFNMSERQGYEHDLVVARRRAERFQRIAQAFMSAVDVERIAAVALHEIVDGIKADFGCVVLVEEDGHRLRTVASHVISTGVQRWAEFETVDHPALRQALASRRPTFLESEAGEPNALQLGDTSDAMSTRVAALPMVIDGRLSGALLLASCSSGAFAPDERSFLVAFAALCAQAVDRAGLHGVATTALARFRFLAELTKALDAELRFEGRAQVLVDLLIPEHADFATVEVPDCGRAPVAARHRHPHLQKPLVALRTRAGVSAEQPHSLARGRASGEVQFIADIAPELYDQYELSAQDRSLLASLSPRSYVGLPLFARNRLVGSLMLAMSDSGRHFDASQLPFFKEIAARAGLALDNARLYDEQSAVALSLQKSLLPPSLASHESLDLYALYRARTLQLEVGGDWYDAFELPNGSIALAVGDVVGHSLDAAVIMGQLRTATRAVAMTACGPADVINELSRFALTVPGADLTTVTYAEFDPASGVLQYVAAGHMPMLHRPVDGPARVLWNGRCRPLGVDGGPKPHAASITLAPGDSILLFTDGLIERRTIIDEGLSELLHLYDADRTSAPKELVESLVGSLTSATSPDDDVCVLIMTLRPRGESAACPSITTRRVKRSADG